MVERWILVLWGLGILALLLDVGLCFPLTQRPTLGRSQWPHNRRRRSSRSSSDVALAVGVAASRRTDRVAVLVEEPFDEEGRLIASELQLSVVTLLGENVEEQERLETFQHFLRLCPYDVPGGCPTYALSLEANSHYRKEEDGNNKKSQQHSKSTTKQQKPCFIDLCPLDSSRAGKRGTGEGGTDLLIKAVGPGKGQSEGRTGGGGAVVYDLTAGMGQDSFVLALKGAREVHMVERDPIVAALLADAIRRLHFLSTLQGLDRRAELAREMSKKLHLHCGDSTKVLHDLLSSGIHPHPDIVYLDPMFPPRKKSAKVKKEMTILHSLLDTQSTDTASEERRLQEELCLLEESIKAAKRKVVVKRPAKAVPLGGDLSPFRPSYAIEGSVNRWDIYVK